MDNCCNAVHPQRGRQHVRAGICPIGQARKEPSEEAVQPQGPQGGRRRDPRRQRWARSRPPKVLACLSACCCDPRHPYGHTGGKTLAVYPRCSGIPAFTNEHVLSQSLGGPQYQLQPPAPALRCYGFFLEMEWNSSGCASSSPIPVLHICRGGHGPRCWKMGCTPPQVRRGVGRLR